jgi:4-amino-4-deoxy-L-arabinose transferase-like glycosyltransferase
MAIRRRNSGARRPAQSASAASSQAKPSHSYAYGFSVLIAAGILLRVLVFAFMGYFNNDNHIVVIEYVSRYWTPPHAAQLNQAYHPPLYYFLAAPFFRLGGLPAVQSLSLLLSIATLLVIAALLRDLSWTKRPLRLACLALAALHPQFLMFGLFISNDSLAIFLGALIFYQCRRVQERGSQGDYVLLGLFLGLGLLTKAVFLVFVLAFAIFVWLDGKRQRLPRAQIVARLAAVLAFAGVLGCYKYLENFLLFGNPTINNLDFAKWIAEQRPTWTGIGSLLDFNILKLVWEPIASASTVHSYPLMLYGTFWYSFLPESTFRSNLLEFFDRIGSLIYLTALWPTVLMLIGAGKIGISASKTSSLTTTVQIASSSDRIIFEATVILTLVLNILLVVSVGWRYDVWSVFQARLIFPAYIGVLIALNSGLEWTESSRFKTNLTRCTFGSLMVLFLAYFITEFWLASTSPTNPLSMEHMPYKIDMKTH